MAWVSATPDDLAMAWTTLASDGFGGAAATFPSRGMDAALGGAANAWGGYGGAAGVTNGAGTANRSSAGVVYDATAAAKVNQFAEVDGVGDWINACGVVFRFDPASGNGYYAYTNGGAIHLFKLSAGGIGAYLGAVGSIGSGGVLRVEAVGSTLSVYADGVLQGSVTDSTYGSGVAGFRWDGGGPMEIDSFRWGDDSVAAAGKVYVPAFCRGGNG